MSIESQARAMIEREVYGPNGESVSFVSEQKPLPPKLPPVPDFDLALCPDNLRDWISDQADGLQVPAEFCAVPAICAAGGVIGRQLAIRVKQSENWLEYPILNAGLVGRPSTGKSPSFRSTLRFLNRLESSRREYWLDEMKSHKVEAELAQAEAQAAKKAAAKELGKGNREKARQAFENVSAEDEAPAEPRLIVNDATIEKLGEILNGNPRGVIQFRDELAGWLASLDREGREADRAFWLETWNGHGPFTVDRIGRGTIRIEAPAVCIIGGIQPGKLESYVRAAVKGGIGDDGLMQRLQMSVYPDVPTGWRYVDREPNPEAQDRAWRVFASLDALDLSEVGAEGEETPFVRFDAVAQELFIEWYTELMTRLRQGNEPPHIESHLAKYPALAARLALVLHMIDSGQGQVSGEALAKALDWLEFLEAHARRIYSPATDNGIAAAHLIAGKREQLPDGFSCRDLYRKGWSGLDRAEAAQSGLNVLVEYGHLGEYEEETATRPVTRYVWRPQS